jgi:hypothetical protein
MMPMDPLLGIRGAVKEDPYGRSLSLHHALDLYSVKARQISMPGISTISRFPETKLADITIISKDIDSVEMTISGGCPVYLSKKMM